MIIFDRQQLRRQRDRAIPRFHEHDFLYHYVANQMVDRLCDIKRDFSNVLVIGTRGAGIILSHLDKAKKISGQPKFLDVDDEMLSAPPDSPYDLVLSLLELHTINDLPGLMAQIQTHLQPDGVFCAALFGGETLYELRDCLQQAEVMMRGGVSPRVYPFADKQKIGALLQRTRYALPVIDSEIVRVDYTNLTKLLHDLRGMGEGNAIAARDKRFLPRDFFKLAEQIYREKYATPDGRLTASFEIIHLIGWSPATSQQQALKPGSAQIRLADALKTQEIKTPD